MLERGFFGIKRQKLKYFYSLNLHKNIKERQMYNNFIKNLQKIRYFVVKMKILHLNVVQKNKPIRQKNFLKN